MYKHNFIKVSRICERERIVSFMYSFIYNKSNIDEFEEKYMPKILMIDNYDSFTYNIIHYLEQLDSVEVEVVQPHELSTYDNAFDAIVISPGPSHPEDRRDTLDFVKSYFTTCPILGICLGHQMLWHMTGGRVTHGKRPIHGHVYKVHHASTHLFEGLSSPFNVTRYHSLVTVGENDAFEVSATTKDDVIMAIHHKTLPVYGLQYHPEAILSEHGLAQLRAFTDIVKGRLS